jgi:hypothetical protein
VAVEALDPDHVKHFVEVHHQSSLLLRQA